MSRLVLVFCVLFLAHGVHASENPHVGLSLEGGLNSPYGLIGAEVSFFPFDQVDFHFGAGVGGDVIYSGGVRVFSKPSECFFFKFCEDRYYLNTSVSQNNGADISEKNNNGTEKIFDINSVTFVNVGIGNRQTFFKFLALDLVLGYRQVLGTVDVQQLSGPADVGTEEEIEGFLQSGLQVSVAIGFVF